MHKLKNSLCHDYKINVLITQCAL